MQISGNDRGQYGNPADTDRQEGKHLGSAGVLVLLGFTVGIYALSPGARHFYKHGHLPPWRR